MMKASMKREVVEMIRWDDEGQRVTQIDDK
jgi:hypothetical protein